MAGELSLGIGTAGWTIPKEVSNHLPAEGSHLERYSRLFDVAEINSSFHRSHRPSTYARWADSVPAHFQFAVKIAKTITHQRKLIDCAELLAAFADEIAGLGDRRGPILIQLPPSLAFDRAIATAFLVDAIRRLGPSIVCEPRNATWFADDADALLRDHGVARVAADPAIVPAATHPGGWTGLAYRRLHGSPVTYRSSYDNNFLARLAGEMRGSERSGTPCWTIFDNTASGAALANALALRARVTLD